MDWFKALSAAYGPASAVALFALGAAVIVLWRAYTASQEARIADSKQGWITLSASTSGDTKVAAAMESLEKRIAALETSLSSTLGTILQIIRESLK